MVLPARCCRFTIFRMMPEARVAAPLSADTAARLAREFYGVSATARSLPGEYDDNFYLSTADARAFILKIMHPAREDSFVDLQCSALLHLAVHAPELSLPRIIPAAKGESYRRAV